MTKPGSARWSERVTFVVTSLTTGLRLLVSSGSTRIGTSIAPIGLTDSVGMNLSAWRDHCPANCQMDGTRQAGSQSQVTELQ